MDSHVYEYTNPSIVRILVAAGTDVNAEDIKKRTALTRACFKSILEIVKILLDSGEADINIKDSDYETPLIFASMAGDTNIVELLLKYDQQIDINAIDRWGMNALMCACHRDHVRIVNLLLEHGADPNIANQRPGYTALTYAIDQDNIQIVKLLLQHMNEHSVNLPDTYGRTPLYYASINNRAKIVELLLKRKTSMKNLQDSMRAALNKGYVGIVNIFYAAGIRLS